MCMVQDGAAVTGLLIAGASLVAVNTTGNAIYDPIGSIIVGNLLGMVTCSLIFLLEIKNVSVFNNLHCISCQFCSFEDINCKFELKRNWLELLLSISRIKYDCTF